MNNYYKNRFMLFYLSIFYIIKIVPFCITCLHAMSHFVFTVLRTVSMQECIICIVAKTDPISLIWGGASMNERGIISIRGISKFFGAVHAVDNVDLEIQRGEVF